MVARLCESEAIAVYRAPGEISYGGKADMEMAI